MRPCFLHGLDSSPRGTKARLLKKRYPHCLIPSLPPDIHERVRIVERRLVEPLLMVGSSLGGLTALMVAMKHPETVEGMVLMAPAVGLSDPNLATPEFNRVLPSLYVPAGVPTINIAGLRDRVIPLPAIRAMIHRSPNPEQIRLHEVDDDHDLHQSLDLMLAAVKTILSA
jgi:pimeloyl-ACP methyl ester carboxylesterase